MMAGIHLMGDDLPWRRLPPPYAKIGCDVSVRDVGINGSKWRSEGTRWTPAHGGPILLASQTWKCDAATDANTNDTSLFVYVLPPFLWGPGGKLVVDAKASWTPSNVVTRLSVYLDEVRLATTTNEGNPAYVSAKWQGLDLTSRLENLTAQLGEADGASGGDAQQATGFAVAAANPANYRKVSIRAKFETAGSGNRVVTLESASLTLHWGG